MFDGRDHPSIAPVTRQRESDFSKSSAGEWTVPRSPHCCILAVRRVLCAVPAALDCSIYQRPYRCYYDQYTLEIPTETHVEMQLTGNHYSKNYYLLYYYFFRIAFRRRPPAIVAAPRPPPALEPTPFTPSLGVTVPLPSVPDWDPSISSVCVPADPSSADLREGTYLPHRLATSDTNHVRRIDGGIAVESSTMCRLPSESSYINRCIKCQEQLSVSNRDQ